jgi:hypothetical protein
MFSEINTVNANLTNGCHSIYNNRSSKLKPSQLNFLIYNRKNKKQETRNKKKQKNKNRYIYIIMTDSEYVFLDNLPKKKTDEVIINQLIEGYEGEDSFGPLANNKEDHNERKNIEKVYQKNGEKNEQKYEQKEHIPIIIENDRYSNSYTAYLPDFYEKKMANEKSYGEVDKESNQKREYKMDSVTNFYVGSLTILGLFILYRMIQKTR